MSKTYQHQIVNNFYPKDLYMWVFFLTFRVDEGGSITTSTRMTHCHEK